MTVHETNQIHRRMNRVSEVVGTLLVDGFHALALFAIGAATVWSAVHAFMGMAAKGHAGVDDILLLFIYLELGAMVGIYFKTNHMPVRFLIYVAMTALTRMLIGDAGAAHKPAQWEILTISGAILLLAFATLVVRYGSARYPSASASSST
jgi:phosphate starvation-inducible membrane PsiE